MCRKNFKFFKFHVKLWKIQNKAKTPMKENAQQTNSTFKWNETRKIYVHTTGIIFPENTCHKFAFSLCVLISKTGRRPCNVINNLIC